MATPIVACIISAHLNILLILFASSILRVLAHFPSFGLSSQWTGLRTDISIYRVYRVACSQLKIGEQRIGNIWGGLGIPNYDQCISFLGLGPQNSALARPPGPDRMCHLGI